jgi:hypothetical protein
MPSAVIDGFLVRIVHRVAYGRSRRRSGKCSHRRISSVMMTAVITDNGTRDGTQRGSRLGGVIGSEFVSRTARRKYGGGNKYDISFHLHTSLFSKFLYCTTVL